MMLCRAHIGATICSVTLVEPMADQTLTSDLADRISADLVRVRHTGLSSYINLPLLHPSGSHVTVKLDPAPGGVRVSDAGFAYREIERLGGERSFSRAARGFAHELQVEAGSRTLFVVVPPDQVSAAVMDVGLASWRTAEKVCTKLLSDNEEEVADILRQRLDAVFGADRVRSAQEISGSSTWKWKVSAVVDAGDSLAIFQAISPAGQSINKASTAFFDFAGLDAPPKLIGVVSAKQQFGPRLGIITRIGAQILEAGEPDDAYKRKAAA